MMRKIVSATFVLSPMLLLAQASPPAQPKTSTSTEVSKLVKPAFTPDLRSTTSTAAPIRISSGIVAPKLVRTSDIMWDGDPYASSKTAVVHLTVDPAGKPMNLSMVRSINSRMDQNVLEGVRHYRFKPGTLDNAPYAVPVDLEIVMHRPSYR